MSLKLQSFGVAWLFGVTLALFPSVLAAQTGYSLRFFGNGYGDIDRVKIAIDDPATSLPGPPADVGATDFTLEFWMRGVASENPTGPIGCGPGNSWINGHIVIDRDRYGQPRNFGLSVADSRLHFGVNGEFGDTYTICGVTDVLDDNWHHVAVQRRRSDGFMWLYVDGELDASIDGPDGDISYPDDGIPGDFCGGPCLFSDPFLVVGAEKHDAGASYPSFSGWFDELRVSATLRYLSGFSVPTAPFDTDPATVALYHLDAGSGNFIEDTAAAPGGPSHGLRSFGGSPAGPIWTLENPFAASCPAPDMLVCSSACDSGSVTLNWLNPVVYGGGVIVNRDGLELFNDPSGTLASYIDVSPGIGTHVYSVVGVCARGPAASNCVIDVLPCGALITVTVPVVAADRNAEYHPPEGEALNNVYDALGLCCGRDADGEYQAAFQFALPIALASTIVQARLTVTATADQSGSPIAQLRTYDVASAAPYSATHTHPLTLHQTIGGPQVSWVFPPFVAGSSYESPDVRELVSWVVNRPDWNSGNVFALVLDGTASSLGAWRCVRNQQSGNPATLTVEYIVPTTGPVLFRRGDCNINGGFNIADAIAILSQLFGLAPASICPAACDMNADGTLNIADPVRGLSTLFASGPPLPEPSGSCGSAAPGDLACDSFSVCVP
ncbi:MAG: LamG-like jellyroll fold domain-containing protein [Planctomycetota bacterium]